MADGVLVDGVRISTQLHRPFLTWMKEITLGAILQGPWGGNPGVDLVVLRDGQKPILHREGPYKAVVAQIRLSEIVARIRLVGIDDFLKEHESGEGATTRAV